MFIRWIWKDKNFSSVERLEKVIDRSRSEWWQPILPTLIVDGSSFDGNRVLDVNYRLLQKATRNSN